MVIVLPLIDLPSAESVIHRLHTLQRYGLITESHRLRAELYIERHFAMFCDSTKMSAGQAADVAVGYTAFAL